MCLILFAVQPSSTHSLIVAANRDEHHARATQRAALWHDAPEVLAGRDLVAGGTWLGVNRAGKFAAVTNFAEVPPEPVPPLSRGALTADFLTSKADCESYLSKVATQAEQFRGFNLLISDGSEVWYFSNRTSLNEISAPPRMKKLEAGFYGLSNQLLDCDWPKVGKGRSELQQLHREHSSKPADSTADHEPLEHALFDVLADTGDGQDHSAKFILGDHYGTSVSTVVLQSQNSIRFEERAFDPTGQQINHVKESLLIKGAPLRHEN